MAVENTTNIAGLDDTLPTGTDTKSEGDNHLRLLKTVLKHVFAGFPGEVLLAATEAQGATVNDYVLTVAPAPAAYATNTTVVFRANHANTGAATLKVGSLAAKALVNPEGTALRANAITATTWVLAVYDGTNFRMVGGGNSQAIYDYADQLAFQAALPGQAGNAGKFLSTNGSVASWQALHQFLTVPTDANTLTADTTFYTWTSGTVTTGAGAANWPASSAINTAGYMRVYRASADDVIQEAYFYANGQKPRAFARIGNSTTGVWQVWMSISSGWLNTTGMPTANAGDIYIDGDGFYSWNGAIYVKSDLSLSTIATLKNQAAAAFGVGQSLVSYNSTDRALATTYTNSTGRPITVQFTGTTNAAGNTQILVNGAVADRSFWDSSSTGASIGVQAVVPSGSTYQITLSGGSRSAWQEYR